MRPLACLLLLLALVAPIRAQPVVFDFEQGYPDDQFYFLKEAAGARIADISVVPGRSGQAAVADWRITASSIGTGAVGFGYLHDSARDTLDMLPDYNHLSLYVRSVEVPDAAVELRLLFQLQERSREVNGDDELIHETWTFRATGLLDQPGGWAEVLMPLRAVDRLGSDGFALPADPLGRGDEQFDLDDIARWSIDIFATGAEPGAELAGVTHFDDLTLVERPLDAEHPDLPADGPALHAVYPNPAGQAATLAFTLDQPAHVTLAVYDVLGRRVAVPMERAHRTTGAHTLPLDVSGLPAGTYAVRLTTGTATATRLVTVAR